MDINRTKKIIYIGVGFLILSLFGYYLFISFFSEEAKIRREEQRITGRIPVPRKTETEIEEIKEQEKIELGSEPVEAILVPLADFPVISLALNPAGDKILFYKKDGGGLFASDFSGKNQEKISNLTVVGLMDAWWAKNGDRAAIFYLDKEILKGFLQIGTSSVAALPQDIKSFSWSPDGRSLAYILQKNNELNLVIADSAARNPKTVFSTPILDARISWTTPDRIVFQTAPSGLAEGFLFTYSRSSGVFARILGPLFGLTSLISPDGSQILAATTDANGRNLKLALYGASGNTTFTITPATLPEKCYWASTSLFYCAVPQAVLTNTIWPDDYLRGELNTSDRILFIDIKTKTINEIYGSDFDVSNLLVSKNQGYLFFIDRKSGTPWSLKLK